MVRPLLGTLGEEYVLGSQNAWSLWPGTGGKRRPGKQQLPQRREAKGPSPESEREELKVRGGVNVKDGAIQGEVRHVTGKPCGVRTEKCALDLEL